jgi:hypothetical protein
MGEQKCIQGFGGGKMREKENLEEPGVNRRIMLRWIFRKWRRGHGLD